MDETADGGTSAYTVASGKTVTSPSLQWRKGSDSSEVFAMPLWVIWYIQEINILNWESIKMVFLELVLVMEMAGLTQL